MSKGDHSLTEFDALVVIVCKRGAAHRSITALAGPPAAGKSTLSEKLEAALNDLEPGSAAVLAMDGYHYDDWVLVPRGLRARKGAPETFDVAGLAHMLRRLRTNDEHEVAVPVFDRSLEIARSGARMIPQSIRHLIVEGNYLLLDRDPWRSLAPLFDTTVLIECEMEVLKERLWARWRGYGLEEAEIEAKVAGNDLVNARLVISESRGAEFHIGAQF
jgi:pantothenate kinase